MNGIESEYLKWNNHLWDYFFNSSNQGQSVYLYASKDVINEIAEKYTLGTVNDFISAIKKISDSDSLQLVKNVKKLYNNFINKDKASTLESPPPYFGLLIFLVYVDLQMEKITKYYYKLREILETEKVSVDSYPNFKETVVFWEHLNDWTVNELEGKKGRFDLPIIYPSYYTIVGYQKSQGILNSAERNLFFQIFFMEELNPELDYSIEDVKSIIIKKEYIEADTLRNRTRRTLKNPQNKERALFLLNKVSELINIWDGSEPQIDYLNLPKKKKAARASPLVLTIAFSPKRLQLRIFSHKLPKKFEFKLKMDNTEKFLTINDYIESRKNRRPIFLTHPLLDEKSVDYISDLDKDFEIINDYNEKYRFKAKEYYILNNGSYLLLRHYIQSNVLIKYNTAYLLVKNNKNNKSLIEWAKEENLIDQSSILPSRLQNGWILYFIRNKPQKVHNKLAINYNQPFRERIFFDTPFKIKSEKDVYYEEFPLEIEIFTKRESDLKIYFKGKDITEHIKSFIEIIALEDKINFKHSLDFSEFIRRSNNIIGNYRIDYGVQLKKSKEFQIESIKKMPINEKIQNSNPSIYPLTDQFGLNKYQDFPIGNLNQLTKIHYSLMILNDKESTDLINLYKLILNSNAEKILIIEKNCNATLKISNESLIHYFKLNRDYKIIILEIKNGFFRILPNEIENRNPLKFDQIKILGNATGEIVNFRKGASLEKIEKWKISLIVGYRKKKRKKEVHYYVITNEKPILDNNNKRRFEWADVFKANLHIMTSKNNSFIQECQNIAKQVKRK